MMKGSGSVRIGKSLFRPLEFRHGPPMPNRFMLAPMTNRQSNEDGTASRAEIDWLSFRAAGGFGHILTTSTSVSREGRSAVGELGVFSDEHIPGLRGLAEQVRDAGPSCAVSIQLNHAGMRALADDPVSSSADSDTGARSMTLEEIDAVVDGFVAAARRAVAAGFDGVQIHGAHGYLISQFLSRDFNRRTDDYGGSLENRSRLLFRIVREVRRHCGDLQLGVRLSPERYGQDFFEIRDIAAQLLAEGAIDYLDMSLWNVFKEADDERAQGRPILQHFTDLPRGDIRLGVAGKIVEPRTAQACVELGADYVALGKVAILHGDYPKQLYADRSFKPGWLPVTADYLRSQRVGEPFVQYLSTWPNFVSDAPAPSSGVSFKSAWTQEELGLAGSDAKA